MSPDLDPYRTLGLERGASLDDVKRAYRRLAKANHPDAAGEAALPRFLAIQAAYDQIAGPDARTRRPGGARGTAGGAARRPWEADAERAGATHRAYGGRARTRPGSRPRPPGPPPGPRPGRSPRPDRPPNKATLGSTSYDGADAEPFDPDWGGASWYGTSSGTYWTLNPKEYADPRKHGPEYQARARRAARQRAGMDPGSADGAGAGAAADASPVTEPAEPAETLASDAGEATAPPEAPTHTATSWWQTRPTEDAAAGPVPRASDRAAYQARPSGARSTPASGTTLADDPEATISTEAIVGSVRAWLDDRAPGIGARIGRAVIAWAPIALGIGWFAGEISGCSRFSAGCSPAVAPLSWAIQLAVLVVLILAAPLARVAARATIVTLAAVIPASVLLLATFDPESMNAGRITLGGLMVIAWVAGIAYGISREVRGPRFDRPVS